MSTVFTPTTRRQPATTPFAVVALTIGLSLLAAPTLASAPAAPQPPKAFIESLHQGLDGMVAKHRKLSALHDAIGQHLSDHVDFPYMGERILGSDTWKGLKDAQRAEFLDLLQKMLRRTYVRRFKPGHKVAVKYNDIKAGKQGRVQVRTEIQVKRTRAEVWYSLRQDEGQWRIFDIVVDEASQLRTYRRSFRKALKKDGWSGLIARMKKSANRK